MINQEKLAQDVERFLQTLIKNTKSTQEKAEEEYEQDPK